MFSCWMLTNLVDPRFSNFSRGFLEVIFSVSEGMTEDDFNHGKYYIHRVHLDFSAALFLSAVWLWQHFLVHDDSLSNTRVLFGDLKPMVAGCDGNFAGL